MAQFAVLYIVFLGIVGHFSKITQSAGSPSLAISPYKDMDLTSGLTSTSITAQKTVMLLHQILLQETSLRMDLEKTVRDLLNEFEQMKKNQMEVKKEQDIINQQLINNIASLRSENQQLKDELGQIVNNSFSTLGMQTCKCDRTNITSDLHDFKREVRQNVSLSLLAFQREMTSIKVSILQTNDNRIGNISRDMFNIQSAFKNLSSFIDSNIQLQASFNDDFLVQQQNISNMMIGTSKKVAFSAIIKHFTSQNEQTVVFSKVLSNVGGAYNNQDGVFTVPISGTYIFFCKITQSSNKYDMLFQFTLNGSAMTNNMVYGRPDHAFRTSSNLIVLQLIPGDRVWIKMVLGGRHYSYGAGGDQSFSGFML
ncbi:uncharacterized protein LOC128184009 [Crassostrea angulata]|uniref:uncharacterized protein LOC128184009 n=1 Tax=Magallana angulata TaxID=2784310 RepID=UPI0022B0C99B|nr:uncharacterized protein LOC128184009 [Crassostrea angulata]